ncbi:MAG: hypothetical protein HFG53_17845 [Lachnospiraceae bacterium]|jgi:hypothetical protein|nr:hypothetical protein [Lachnospiraceae bacterium]
MYKDLEDELWESLLKAAVIENSQNEIKDCPSEQEINRIVLPEHYEAPTTDNSVSLVSPRFAYIMDGAILVNPGSSGVDYSVRVSGIDEITSISGKMTIYKDGTSIYTRNLSTSKSELRVTGTISTKGPGTYKITFSGTVKTASRSETIDMDMEDSY